MTEPREAMRTIERNPRVWAREFVANEVWRHEQTRISRRAWSLLGMTSDVAADGDWIVASLAGRSVFVQRFGDTLVGFENICAHRFFPLRTEARGTFIWCRETPAPRIEVGTPQFPAQLVLSGDGRSRLPARGAGLPPAPNRLRQ